jgi:hypothetical protein
MRFIIFIVGTFFLFDAQAATSSPKRLYGERIEFDVMRKGEVVGEHITRFEKIDDALRVTSTMNIEIFFLFLPVYAFHYRTEEIWQNGQMISLDVNVLDGPDRTIFRAKRKDAKLNVVLTDNAYHVTGNIISTNHWNADVVFQNKVLNTLTGNMNDVIITPKGTETIKVTDGFLNANRYDYSGDLTDTSVWYDEKGRWVKLRFLARDGSEIEYRCRTCSSGEAS